MQQCIQEISITKLHNASLDLIQDVVTVEEPLEIILIHGNESHRVKTNWGVTMRTPGEDYHLILGLLFNEGIIHKAQHVVQCRHFAIRTEEGSILHQVHVDLDPELRLDPDFKSRDTIANSSCGVCGSKSIAEALKHACFILKPNQPKISIPQVYQLPEILHAAQSAFEKTGGIHAVCLIDQQNNVVLTSEDIGRHNALDKLIGKALEKGMLPLDDYILILSGRAGFEMIQKSVNAGIPILASIGAASSLAIELAQIFGMTLIGFVKHNKANVYCGIQRIIQ